RVPSSSAPISREYSTTSAQRIAASRRSTLSSSTRPLPALFCQDSSHARAGRSSVCSHDARARSLTETQEEIGKVRRKISDGHGWFSGLPDTLHHLFGVPARPAKGEFPLGCPNSNLTLTIQPSARLRYDLIVEVSLLPSIFFRRV